LERDFENNRRAFADNNVAEGRAMRDEIYGRSPDLQMQELASKQDWGKATGRYLHFSPDGESASIRSDRPQSHTTNFGELSRYIGKLDPSDIRYSAALEGVKRYVEQFNDEAKSWDNATRKKTRTELLAKIDAMLENQVPR
jgi:hypothetical protein